MKRLATQYFQYEQRFLTTTLNYESLSKISEVLKYGESKYGYQREVNQLHLNRMVNTLRKTTELLSPTSIILGVSSTNIERCIKEVNLSEQIDFYNNQEKVFKFDIDQVDFKFRIIDGQHRISAFEKYLLDSNLEEKKRRILEHDYIFNVVIFVMEDKDRKKEVELFRTINSKAKPLKTDLAMLATYNYEIIFKERNISPEEHIKTRIIFLLNEGQSFDGKNYWLNGIKVDVNNNQALGSIGFKAFGESIQNIVKIYVEKNPEIFNDLLDLNFDDIDRILKDSAIFLAEKLIIPSWNHIYKKWPESFLEVNNIQNEEMEKTFYNKDYYIQQTMGVKSLHGILTDIYKETRVEELAVQKFEEILNNSSLIYLDWKKNGKMRGLSSEAGFKIIRDMIKNLIK